MGGKGELMAEITITQLMWMMIALIATVGLLILLSAITTGYLVFRTKKESHEPLITKGVPKSRGAQNIDEFSWDDGVKEDDGSVLPDVIKQMNEKIGAIMATDNLQKKSTGDQ